MSGYSVTRISRFPPYNILTPQFQYTKVMQKKSLLHRFPAYNIADPRKWETTP